MPRENKYSHACCIGIRAHTETNPAISTVICNFPKATGDKPSLLKFNDVLTFFHEFGHAIHQTLGSARMPTDRGYHCVHDFVELPSQLLESWLYESSILDLISSHYVTGEKLPTELVTALQKSKQCMAGYYLYRQLYLSLLSLTYHTDYCTDPKTHQDNIFKGAHNGKLICLPENHGYASFGHLYEYDAQYYNYKVTEVYACDIFNYIKEHNGLLDPKMGRKYIDCIIGVGGSINPTIMMRNFLGRDVSEEPYLKEYGLL